MEVDINIWGVVWAAVSSMVVGSIWYSKGVFGPPWMKLAGLSERQFKEMQQKDGWMPMATMFVLALIMAYVLAHVTYLSAEFFTDASYHYAAVSSGFWMWLGFVVPTTLGTGLFSGTRKKLMALNLGNWLVTLLVMGWVIGFVGL